MRALGSALLVLLVAVGCGRQGEPPPASQAPVAAQPSPPAVPAKGTTMLRLETRRFVLRPFTAADWQDFQVLGRDWAAAPGPAFDKWPTTDAACQAAVKHMATSDQYLALCRRDSGQVVGLLALNGMDAAKRLDLGHVILAKYQDGDHDREALQAVIQHCFDRAGAAAVITRNAPDHAAQLAPLKALGFTNQNAMAPGELVLSREAWAQRGPSPAAPAAAPAPRRVLAVPGFRYIHDGLNPFTLCLKACLTFLGTPRTYGELLGGSGACFRMTWRHTAWDEGNMDLAHLGSAALRRGVQSAGYRPRFLVKPDWWRDETAPDLARVADDAAGQAALRAAIVASLDAGLPVLAFGVVGPPEVSLVAGYDAGGDVLIGWSCFAGELPADQREPNGMYRQPDWFAKTRGVILFDGTLDAAAVARVRGEALAWAYRVMTMPKGKTHEFGAPAYQGWGFALVKDYEFPAGDEPVLQSRRYTVWDGLIMQAERGHAADMLEREAAARPAAAASLREAAQHLRAEHELCGRAQDAMGGPMLPSAGLADPVKRRAAIDVILACRDHYVQATQHLARALGQEPPGVVRDAKELAGLRPAYRVMTLLGTVLGAMRYAGKDVDPAWLYGISGAAFMLNIDRQVDCSGPTSWDECEHFAPMLPYLGVTIAHAVAARTSDADFVAKHEAARAFIQAKVDAGIPCVGWDGGFPEYVTINGYTPSAVIEWTNYVPGGYRVMPWEKFGRNDTGNFKVFSVEPMAPPGDERAAIRLALEYALSLRVAPGPPLDRNHAHGMQGYDLWLWCLETGEWRKNPFWGVHHNVACWSECRVYAEAFLRLAGQKLGGELAPLCEQAADHYRVVRTALGQMQAVFLYQYPQPPVSAAGEARAIELLRTARDAEARGLAVIERIVGALTKPPPP